MLWKRIARIGGMALLLSICLAGWSYQLKPNIANKSYSAGGSEVVIVHGMPEPLYVVSQGALHGLTHNWVKAVIWNWSAIFFWMIFGYVFLLIAAKAGIFLARFVSRDRSKT